MECFIQRIHTANSWSSWFNKNSIARLCLQCYQKGDLWCHRNFHWLWRWWSLTQLVHLHVDPIFCIKLMFVDPFTPKSDQFSLLRWKLIEQLFLTMSLKHFLLEWLGEFGYAALMLWLIFRAVGYIFMPFHWLFAYNVQCGFSFGTLGLCGWAGCGQWH